MLNFQCRQPNRTTMARTLKLALLLGHPLLEEFTKICQSFPISRHTDQDYNPVCIVNSLTFSVRVVEIRWWGGFMLVRTSCSRP